MHAFTTIKFAILPIVYLFYLNINMYITRCRHLCSTRKQKQYRTTNIHCDIKIIQIGWLIDLFLMFNATFSNISAISWRPVLVVEEAVVSGENHLPRASTW